MRKLKLLVSSGFQAHQICFWSHMLLDTCTYIAKMFLAPDRLLLRISCSNKAKGFPFGLVKQKALETLFTGVHSLLDFKTAIIYIYYSLLLKNLFNITNLLLFFIFRWVIGEAPSAINDFAFSPCSKYLAVVSQDGCLRVFNYDAMELIGLATSFFGGLLCVCWSPDGHLVVAGGEDDLVTVWSFQQRRVVARGQGHRSWITVVAFDPFTTTYSSSSLPPSSSTSSSSNNGNPTSKETGDPTTIITNGVSDSESSSTGGEQQPMLSPDIATCYRLGSVAMDTQVKLRFLNHY